MIHDFANSLRLSQKYANAPWWESVYREAFPSFSTMTYVGDCPAQRDGVDRVVLTVTGHTYRVDEKVRERDYQDIFLEYWSIKEKREPGWVAKDLACDFIAYAFIPSQRCYLLPFPTLRRAWKAHHEEWVATYGRRAVPNTRYTTEGVPVPISALMDALSDATLIRWQAPTVNVIPGTFESEWGPEEAA